MKIEQHDPLQPKRPKGPSAVDQAMTWAGSSTYQAMTTAIAMSQDDSDQGKAMKLLKLAFEAGYYAGLADPLPEAK